MKTKTHSFTAKLEIIGINPYVAIPETILQALFEAAGKDKGPIPITGTVNGKPYLQTLVKYAGAWRLYINTAMLEKSPQRIGEEITATIGFDPKDRTLAMHPLLKEAIDGNPAAKSVFDGLPPSRKKEIVRYIANLKTEEKIASNIAKAINFLLGKEKFAGREKP